MSGSKNVDLSALARATEEVERPRRSWTRIALPLAIVAVFLFLLRDAIVEIVVPRIEVEIVRPTRIEGEGVGGADAIAADTVAVQAAGWVEPDPFPVLVPALAGGTVAELLVQESDPVTAGDTVARLVDDDARIVRDRAAAALATAEAAGAANRARATIANERFDAALEVTEAEAAARARQAGLEAEVELRGAAVAEGEARVELAESEVIVQRELDEAGASGPRQVEIAEAELVVARAVLQRLRADATATGAKEREAAAQLERATRELDLRFADRLERDVAIAELERTLALVEEARAELAAAELALARTTVVASTSGVVLERLVGAGSQLAPGEAICSVWRPDSLRVRVDVPLGDMEKLFVGQRAAVTSDSRPGRPYAGEVVRIVQLADIQKVTLEAQVQVLDADELLRPDMLSQVKFYGARATASDSEQGSRRSSGGVRIALPARVVEDGAVWVFDPVERVARRVEVETGPAYGEPRMVEILAGLDLTDKVIDTGRAQVAAAGGPQEPVPVIVREEELSNSGGRQ
ncbi:putative efflux pump membrane fusion protein [Planctomycetes bacterium Pla163]|uniref:Putative efflux pump membrane fusion protein n=1 Tax=Rohdeia mirabilis TaxID=2528008 RepID=A0A518CVU4_9BACT|nr:putative efflux pump membrane fusion protein [Planctomycetes bacterium Pla163]